MDFSEVEALFRFMIVGAYVGVATVGIFIYWYSYYDWAEYSHTLIPVDQLRNWTKCQNWNNFSGKGCMKWKDITRLTLVKTLVDTLPLAKPRLPL